MFNVGQIEMAFKELVVKEPLETSRDIQTVHHICYLMSDFTKSNF